MSFGFFFSPLAVLVFSSYSARLVCLILFVGLFVPSGSFAFFVGNLDFKGMPLILSCGLFVS